MSGVIACAGHRRVDPGKNGAAVVVDLAGFAVHELSGADNFAAKAAPMAWWPRQTPRMGTLPDMWRMRPMEIPASCGVQGPGERTIAVRCEGFRLLRGVSSSLRRTTDVGAEFTDVLDEVEGEGIVVVENENHSFVSVAPGSPLPPHVFVKCYETRRVGSLRPAALRVQVIEKK